MPLLDEVVAAAGGLARWQRLTEITAQVQVGGSMWARKGQAGVIADTQVAVSAHEQHTTYAPFGDTGQRSRYWPGRVEIAASDGTLVAARDQPRAAFDHLAADAAWDLLHAAYFSGYAMWTYLTVPFLFTWDGVVTRELAPWAETSDWTGGRAELWRPLEVTFPPGIATHNAVQTFYYDHKLNLRRHDYNADVFGGTPTAHYSADPATVDGLVFPTRRRVVPRRADGTTPAGPVLVAIDLGSIKLR
jgi:hypothetical protein